jgi:hypothetical protein
MIFLLKISTGTIFSMMGADAPIPPVVMNGRRSRRFSDENLLQPILTDATIGSPQGRSRGGFDCRSIVYVELPKEGHARKGK